MDAARGQPSGEQFRGIAQHDEILERESIAAGLVALARDEPRADICAHLRLRHSKQTSRVARAVGSCVQPLPRLGALARPAATPIGTSTPAAKLCFGQYRSGIKCIPHHEPGTPPTNGTYRARTSEERSWLEFGERKKGRRVSKGIAPIVTPLESGPAVHVSRTYAIADRAPANTRSSQRGEYARLNTRSRLFSPGAAVFGPAQSPSAGDKSRFAGPWTTRPKASKREP